MTEIVNSMEALTPEEIQRHYEAAMDSVNLLNAGKPQGMRDENWPDCKKRNVDHLKIMVAKDFWQGQDMAPLNAAIAANE